MFKFKTLKFSTRILLLTLGSVLLTVVALTAAIIWQSGQFNVLAQVQVDKLIDADLSHIVEGVYNLIKTQDEAVQVQVNTSLEAARQLLNDTGDVTQATDRLEWTAVNQLTQESSSIELPKLLIGGVWLGKNIDPAVTTPVVDQIQNLVGGAVTIFQRMNARGDMLRVATNVRGNDGQRAIGTYIPAVNPDGTPNLIFTTVLRGETYHGSAYVVNAWYNSAYEPLRDEAGQVIGMLFVGAKQANVDTVRQAILQTKVGKDGYVYVIGSQGDDLGRYILSEKGQRDGENIWNTQDAEGRYVIQNVVNTALTLGPGQTARVRYLWQNLGDTTPRWKVAQVAYYEPWHWVIGANAVEDDFNDYRLALQAGQTSLVVVAGVAGVIVALLASLIAAWLARSIARPIGDLANVADLIAGGDLTLSASVTGQDEIGTLARAFNSMTGQLRNLITSLEDRVRASTEQLRASADVGRAATSILDVDQLIRTAVNLITDRFGFYYAALFTLDATGQVAVLREATGEAGRVLKERGHRLEVGSQSMVGAAITFRHARIALDAGSEAVRFANPLLPDTQSEIALPLIIGERVIGVLDVQSQQAGAFDETNTAVLQSMADQIAIALHNAELFSRSEQQTWTLTILNQLSRELALATSLEGIARALRTSIVNLIGPQQIALLLASSDARHLIVYPLNLKREPVLSEGRPMETDRSRAGDSLISGRTLHIPDLTTAPDPYHNNIPLLQAGLRSTLIVPLRIGDKRLGALSIGHETPDAYSPELIKQMEQVAAQLAVALENLQLVERTRQALNELDAANRRLIGQAWEHYARTTDVIQGEWRAGRWLTHQADRLAAPDGHDLQVALKVRGATIGEFAIQAQDGQRDWTPDDIAFAQILVDQVGQLIENARLLEETERLANRERTINEINARVRQTVTIDLILKTAVNELGKSLTATHIFARISQPETAHEGHD
jgi:GAF domain-containing protein/HAMP domain-containing protein